MAHDGRRRTYSRRLETRQATCAGEVPANAGKIIETTHSPTRHGGLGTYLLAACGGFWADLYLQATKAIAAPEQKLSPTLVSPLTKLRRVCPAWGIAAVLAAVVLAGAHHPAKAQGQLEAEYVTTLTGIPIGRGTWIIDVSEDEVTAAANGATAGLLRIFASGTGMGATRGTIAGGRIMPLTYAATVTTKDRIDDVRIAFAGGNVKDFTVEPPVGPNPDRIPVTEADRRNVVDPMISTMNYVAGSADPLSPQSCTRRVSVFDGRLRYDLNSDFKRVETVKASKGYQGPVLVCAVYFTPVSGYLPNSTAIKYLASIRDAEAWMAPIAGTRILVPFRFSLPTPIGVGVIEATQFLTVAKPPRAAANTKGQ